MAIFQLFLGIIWEKNPRSNKARMLQGENKVNPQIAPERNRTRTTLVGGEQSLKIPQRLFGFSIIRANLVVYN